MIYRLLLRLQTEKEIIGFRGEIWRKLNHTKVLTKTWRAEVFSTKRERNMKQKKQMRVILVFMLVNILLMYLVIMLRQIVYITKLNKVEILTEITMILRLHQQK